MPELGVDSKVGHFSTPQASLIELFASLRAGSSKQLWQEPGDRSGRPKLKLPSRWGHPASTALTAPLRAFREAQALDEITDTLVHQQ